MTENKINKIMKEVAENAVTSHYPDRECTEDGKRVICVCPKSGVQHHGIIWKTSLEGDYIQAAFHFYCPMVGDSFMRIAKVYKEDDDESAYDKIHKAFESGLKRGKGIYEE